MTSFHKQSQSRVAVSLLASALIATSLAACGESDSPSTPTTSGGAASAGATSNGGTNSSGGASSGSGGESRGGSLSSGGAESAGGAPTSSGGLGSTSGGQHAETGGAETGGAESSGGSTAEAGSAGMNAGDGGTAAEDLLEKARAEYKSWRTKTAEPQNISAAIFSLCRLPTSMEQEFAEGVHGDNLYLLDWLSADAYDLFQAGGGKPFPEGAAIVKEKLVITSLEPRQEEIAALGIMVKRYPGFDAASGDWEFGYWEPNAGMSRGAEMNAACGPCHAKSKTDHVFFDSSWHLWE